MMLMIASAPFDDDKQAPHAKHTKVGTERSYHRHQ